MIICPDGTKGNPRCLPGVSESVLGADRKLTASAVVVYRAMAELAASTGRCFAAVSTIAQRAVKSPATVKRAVRDLAFHGYLIAYADATKKTRRAFLLPSAPEPSNRGSESPGDRRRARDLELHQARASSESMSGSLRGQNLTPKEALIQSVPEGEANSSPSCVCAREAGSSSSSPVPGAASPNSLGDPTFVDPALDARLIELASQAGMAMGLTDQNDLVEAMVARFGPMDSKDFRPGYRSCIRKAADGAAGPGVLAEAVRRALRPTARVPGAIFLKTFRLIEICDMCTEPAEDSAGKLGT